LFRGADVAAIEFAGKCALTEIVHHPVNPRFNTARIEGAELIEPQGLLLAATDLHSYVVPITVAIVIQTSLGRGLCLYGKVQA